MSKKDRILLWMVVSLWLFTLMFVGVRHAFGDSPVGIRKPQFMEDRRTELKSPTQRFPGSLQIKYFMVVGVGPTAKYLNLEETLPKINEFIRTHKVLRMFTYYDGNGYLSTVEILYVEKGD